MPFHASNRSPHVSMMSDDSIDREKNAGVPLVADPAEHSRLQREDSVLKQKIRYFRFFARLGATVLAIATMIQESLMLAKFITTKDDIRGGRGPWAKQTSLWPAIMLLSVSVVSVLMGSLILTAYAHSIRTANNVALFQTWFVSLVEGAHIITWIVVAVLYRTGKTGKDLWGWACSPGAQKIQVNFEGIVNFNKVCSRGGNQWRLAIANAALQLLTGFIFILMWQRRKVKKQMKKNVVT